jgi:hypothetical protein
VEYLKVHLHPRSVRYAREGLHLTLIGPGEVKVGLADFYLKLQENLFCTYFFIFTNLFLGKSLPNLILLQTQRQKMMFNIHFNAIMSKVRPWRYHCPPRVILQLFWTTRRGRSPNRLWSAVRRCASQDSNQFLIPGHTECGSGGFSVRSAL